MGYRSSWCKECCRTASPRGGDAVEMKRLIDPASIRAQSVGRMIVSHDKENIGIFFDISPTFKCSSRKFGFYTATLTVKHAPK